MTQDYDDHRDSDDNDPCEQARTKKSSGPEGPGVLLGRLFGDDNPVLDQLDRNARLLAQSALSKLDVVTRQEFDAQSAVLARTRQRVIELEAELERLSEVVDSQLTKD